MQLPRDMRSMCFRFFLIFDVSWLLQIIVESMELWKDKSSLKVLIHMSEVGSSAL